ncbi:MAG: hypothetical protein GY950_10640 [bacterium]|nr:hypothetical protein [bacterium]
MLRKEFNEILKQSFYFIAFVVGMSVLLSVMSLIFKWGVSLGEFFAAVYYVGLCIFALVTGVTLFSSDRKQGGLEYLLTLPFSRMRLLWMKILPRFTVLFGFSLLGLLFYHVIPVVSSVDLPPFYPVYAVFMGFFLSVSLSASHDNFVLLSIGTLFIFGIHAWLTANVLPKFLRHVFGRFFWVEGPWIIVVLGVLGLLIPFLIAFLAAFKKFDAHPGRRFNRLHLKVLVPVLVTGLLLSVLFAYGISEKDRKSYYLTKNHKLIESDWFSARIHHLDGGDVTIIDEPVIGYPWMMQESDGYIYNKVYMKNKMCFNRLNPETGDVEILYEFKGGSTVYTRGYWMSEKTVAFFEGTHNSGDITLVFLDTVSMAVKKIKLYGKIPTRNTRFWLFGADKSEGKRFWLLAAERFKPFPIFRVWEDGTIEELGKTLHRPFYVNGMLITLDEEGVVFSRLTAEGPEEIKRIPSGKGVFLRSGGFWGSKLVNVPYKEIYGTRFNKKSSSLIKVDLENFEVSLVMERKGFFRMFSPDKCYFLDSYTSPDKFYRVQKDGTLKLLRSFGGFDRRKKGNYFRITGNGIIFSKDGKISVYAFPDLKELTFDSVN